MHQKKTNAETLCKKWFVPFVPWSPSSMSNHDGKWVFYNYHMYIYIYIYIYNIYIYIIYICIYIFKNLLKKESLGKYEWLIHRIFLETLIGSLTNVLFFEILGKYTRKIAINAQRCWSYLYNCGKITLRTLKGEGGNVHAHSLAPVLFLE